MDKKNLMTKNDKVWQNMNATEILCYLRCKYPNINSRACSLARMKTFIKTKQTAAFCDELKLSSDEYKAIVIHRRQQAIKEKMRPQLSAKQMYLQSLHTVDHSSSPGKLLPCLVFLTGLKPSVLFQNENDLENPVLRKILNICRKKWPCEDLSRAQIKSYQAIWRYHLSRMFPHITFSQLCQVGQETVIHNFI